MEDAVNTREARGLGRTSTRVAGGVDDHANVLLGLVGSDCRTQGECLGDRRVEVGDLKVNVHHGALLAVESRQTGR